MTHSDFAIRTAIVCGIGTLAIWLSVCLPINEFFIHKAMLEYMGPHEYLRNEIPNQTTKIDARLAESTSEPEAE